MLSQFPFAPRFLSRRAAASSSASVVPEVLFLYWQRVRIPCDTIDTRGLLDFESFYPTDPRITDRPTHEQKVCKKNCPIFGKAYMFKVEIFERQCLVFFVEQRDFDDLGIDDLINEEPSPISARRARHVGGRRRDTHTAKCEHTVKHYCFIDIDTVSQARMYRLYSLPSDGQRVHVGMTVNSFF